VRRTGLSDFGGSEFLSSVSNILNAVEKVGFAAVIKFGDFICAWAAQLIGTMSASEALQDGFSCVEYHPPSYPA